MSKKGSNTGGNRISRLDFLKLLGAGAIGYFAYRAGFINNLFGNAATAARGGIANTTTRIYNGSITFIIYSISSRKVR
jgi:hypothetical protein